MPLPFHAGSAVLEYSGIFVESAAVIFYHTLADFSGVDLNVFLRAEIYRVTKILRQLLLLPYAPR